MDEPDRIGAVLRVQRVILLAMLIAVVGLTVVAVTAGGAKVDEATARLEWMVLGVIALLELPVYLVLRGVLIGQLRAKVQDLESRDAVLETVLPTHTMLTILGAAMAEGIGVFGAVIHLMTGERLVLLAPALAVILLFAQFPTRQGISDLVARITGRRWD